MTTEFTFLGKGCIGNKISTSELSLLGRRQICQKKKKKKKKKTTTDLSLLEKIELTINKTSSNKFSLLGWSRICNKTSTKEFSLLGRGQIGNITSATEFSLKTSYRYVRGGFRSFPVYADVPNLYIHRVKQ